MEPNLCRLCIVKIEQQNSSNFVAKIDNEIYTKIQMHLNLDVKKNEINSSSICSSCVQKINEFHEYYQTVHKNQEEFNKILIKLKETLPENNSTDFETVTIEVTKKLECDLESIPNEIDTCTRRSTRKKSKILENSSNLTEISDIKNEIVSFDEIKNDTEQNNCSDPLKSKRKTRINTKRKKDINKTLSILEKKPKESDESTLIAKEEENVNCSLTDCDQNDNDSDEDKDYNYEHFENNQKIENVSFPESVYKNGKLQIRGSELKRHMERFFLLVCDLCPRQTENEVDDDNLIKFSTINALFSHYKTIHDVRGYVVCCGRKFDRKIMPRHFAFHINPEEFTCKLCGYKTFRQYSLKLHIERLHSADSERKRFSCRFCGRSYTTAASLEQHQAEKHPSDDKESKFICGECEKKFNSEYRLKKHIKNVHVEETHVCDVCGMKFRLKGNLKTHQATHADVKNFQCEICGKWFISKSMVRRHLKRAHPSNDELKCDQCDYKTLHTINLKNHIRIRHTDQKPYSCPFCDRRFKTSTNQKEHLSQHTGVKIQCEFCSKEFLTKSNYYAHRKKTHFQELMASKAKQEAATY